MLVITKGEDVAGILRVEAGDGVEDSKMLKAEHSFISVALMLRWRIRIRGIPSYFHVRCRALLANA